MDTEIKVWWILHGGERQGPYARSQLQSMADINKISGADLVWKEGLAAPIQARQVISPLPRQAPSPADNAPTNNADRPVIDITLPLTAGTPENDTTRTTRGLKALSLTFVLAAAASSPIVSVGGHGSTKALHDATQVWLSLLGAGFGLILLFVFASNLLGRRGTRQRQEFAAASGFEFTKWPAGNYGPAIVDQSVLARG